MLIAGRLSDKPQNTNLIETPPKKNKIKENSRVPGDWNASDPIQLKYNEMISNLILPAGFIFWSFYFRYVIIPGCARIHLRVQRIARKKEDGGYETHAILFLDGIPYLANTVDFFLEMARESEKCPLEEMEELEDKEKSYFQWLRSKIAEELVCLDQLNLSLKNTSEEISVAFIKKLSRQVFQNSRLKIRLISEVPT